MFKSFLIMTEFGKFGRKIWQIRQISLNCQLSLSFGRTQIIDNLSTSRLDTIDPTYWSRRLVQDARIYHKSVLFKTKILY